jgi:hypothetical protein
MHLFRLIVPALTAQHLRQVGSCSSFTFSKKLHNHAIYFLPDSTIPSAKPCLRTDVPTAELSSEREYCGSTYPQYHIDLLHALVNGRIAARIPNCSLASTSFIDRRCSITEAHVLTICDIAPPLPKHFHTNHTLCYVQATPDFP